VLEKFKQIRHVHLVVHADLKKNYPSTTSKNMWLSTCNYVIHQNKVSSFLGKTIIQIWQVMWERP